MNRTCTFRLFIAKGESGQARSLASVPMAAVMAMAAVVTRPGSLPAIARVGVSAPVVLAICVRIELGAPPGIGNHVLR